MHYLIIIIIIIISLTLCHIINNTDFVGASGHVSFNKLGDRINGLYSFASILDNGSIDYFGYFYHDEIGKIHCHLNKSKIRFPKYFGDVIPQSQINISVKLENINTVAILMTFVLSFISFSVALFFMITLIIYRNKAAIRKVSWRLNVVMCIGAMLGCITAICYGIDETIITSETSFINLDNMCNFRLWIITLSYTLLFMPLFLKTYRLSRIFKKVLTSRVIQDKHLFIGLLLCILIDLIVLTMVTIIVPSFREFYNGQLETIDELRKRQVTYAKCASDEGGIYLLLVFMKMCELIFGIYMALGVARIRDVTNILPTLDETGIQLLSIVFTVIIIGVITPLYSITKEAPTFCYLIIGISILLVLNIVLFLNLFPRIYAVITRNDEKYHITPIERIENELKSKFKCLPQIVEIVMQKKVSVYRKIKVLQRCHSTPL